MAMISFRSLLQQLRKKLCKEGSKPSQFVARGYFPVYVIEEQKIMRYMIPVESSSSIMLRALFKQFEDDIDRAHHAITLSCSAVIFEAVLNLSVNEKHPWKKEVLNSRN